MTKSSKTPLSAVAGAPDRPLIIGGIEIDCYVLEDEQRVLSQRGVYAALNISRGGARVASGANAEFPRFASQQWISPFIFGELGDALKSPIYFMRPTGGMAHGYPAVILADICSAITDAFHAGQTTDRQQALIERAMVLLKGFAKVGIVALVDEATGYQRIREERALATILERYLDSALHPATKTFPFEFYEQIFRLKKWSNPEGVKRPSVIGHYTNDIVYERLPPGVLEELKRRNPTISPGRRRHRHHQWFTRDVGHPKLKEHLNGVILLMKAAPNWGAFRRSLTRALPKPGEQVALALGDDE